MGALNARYKTTPTERLHILRAAAYGGGAATHVCPQGVMTASWQGSTHTTHCMACTTRLASTMRPHSTLSVRSVVGLAGGGGPISGFGGGGG